MRIYLDNCCFNRPFDRQASIKVKLETDAKIFVQLSIKKGKIELAWSYILDFENEANPFKERKNIIAQWKNLTVIDIAENYNVLSKATKFANTGIKAKDALHIACAIEAGCKYFLTTDDGILKKTFEVNEIIVINPVDFIKIIEEL
jgi:predicted nucleic acid-binding protein